MNEILIRALANRIKAEQMTIEQIPEALKSQVGEVVNNVGQSVITKEE